MKRSVRTNGMLLVNETLKLQTYAKNAAIFAVKFEEFCNSKALLIFQKKIFTTMILCLLEDLTNPGLIV